MAKTARVICIVGATALFAWAAATGSARVDEAQEAWNRGNAAFLGGDLDAAIRHYSDAIRLDPNDAVTHNNRGYAYLQKGEADKAVADYDDAIRLDPKYAKAYFFRGSVHEDKGEQDKAVTDYTAAIRLDPEYARAYCDRGRTEPAIATDGPAQFWRKARGAARGANFFVAPNGNDRNRGTFDQPFATIYKALQWIRPGETINLRAGTYEAQLSWNKGGTPTAPITIQAYNGEDVTLVSAEQWAWSRVTDPTLGDCWKAAIPYRRIQYPGLQKAICENAEHAAADPGFQVCAIVKGGYMCAAMHAAADFARPQAAAGLPLTDGSGKLKYDITWYDRGAKTLWFKPGPSGVTDPSRQLYVTSPGSGQVSLDGSYVRLNGLKFKYLYFFHQQPNLAGCDMNNCEIKHAGGGIVGGGARCTYTSLFVDKIGNWMCWRDGRYQKAYLGHCLYFNGTRCVISNCFFGRSNMGGPIQNYPQGVAQNLFDGNVLYNSDGGSIFMGNSRNYITNNISLQKSRGILPYISMQGFTIAHNYSEAPLPFAFDCQGADGSYVGTFEKFAITDNVFNNTGGLISLAGNVVDARSCNIDRNVYLGSQSWRVELAQTDQPFVGRKDCHSYASYAAALQALPNCATWEKNSRASAAAPRFDFASFDALLDADPPLAAVLLKTRQYVKGVTAPFPGAGPAIAAPPAADRGREVRPTINGGLESWRKP